MLLKYTKKRVPDVAVFDKCLSLRVRASPTNGAVVAVTD